MYVYLLLSLKLIWEASCNDIGIESGRDGLENGILSDISYSGELVFANAIGEIKCFSLFAESTALESAMLERMPVKTRLYLPDRAVVFGSKSIIHSGQ